MDLFKFVFVLVFKGSEFLLNIKNTIKAFEQFELIWKDHFRSDDEHMPESFCTFTFGFSSMLRIEYLFAM